jgi:hypothetical protein
MVSGKMLSGDVERTELTEDQPVIFGFIERIQWNFFYVLRPKIRNWAADSRVYASRLVSCYNRIVPWVCICRSKVDVCVKKKRKSVSTGSGYSNRWTCGLYMRINKKEINYAADITNLWRNSYRAAWYIVDRLLVTRRPNTYPPPLWSWHWYTVSDILCFYRCFERSEWLW